MPTLKPFRDYSEHFVLNMFGYSGTVPVNRGTFVKIIGSGFVNTNPDVTETFGSVGSAYQNAVSLRYGVPAKVTAAVSGDTPIGLLLWDVKETDENGENLKFNPRKAAELQIALSGQAVPILTKGVVLYSGVSGTSITAGSTAYMAGDSTVVNSAAFGGATIGKFLGTKDTNGCVLLRVDL